MAMGRRRRAVQGEFWVAVDELPPAPAHPFYVQINKLLDGGGFDGFVEERCRQFYAEVMGRPSLPPAIYFRLLLVGYFEGIDSERGIAWRLADSLGLRQFVGYQVTDNTPDHSVLSRTRRLIDLETHQEVFTWTLGVLAQAGLLKSRTIGIDATTLEANAAMRSIVRRDSGEGYQEFLTRLAAESGIETPTREELVKLDKTRKNKASNDDWQSPSDPDAKIAKMKDGRTHLAHKAEHAVDMESGAIVAVTLQPADRGDTTSIGETLEQAAENIVSVVASGAEVSAAALTEIVADKGYHSNAALVEHSHLRTYISEPDRGPRNWVGKRAERDAVYANRRRIRGARGRRLMRRRGELIERSFAHCYDTGGMRRTHLRGRDNILKRALVHVAGFNLSLVMRKLLGAGTPRGWTGLAARIWSRLCDHPVWWSFIAALRELYAAVTPRMMCGLRAAA
ncbi:MAG: transposase [Caldilineaceae bacterium]|nr:transposase [Caldilineaceae bacterium]